MEREREVGHGERRGDGRRGRDEAPRDGARAARPSPSGAAREECRVRVAERDGDEREHRERVECGKAQRDHVERTRDRRRCAAPPQAIEVEVDGGLPPSPVIVVVVVVVSRVASPLRVVGIESPRVREIRVEIRVTTLCLF